MIEKEVTSVLFISQRTERESWTEKMLNSGGKLPYFGEKHIPADL